MDMAVNTVTPKTPWNRGKLLGQKPPLRLKDIWAIRIRLQLAKKTRDRRAHRDLNIRRLVTDHRVVTKPARSGH